MYDEFHGGRDLLADDIDEDDIESLLIQQIEFCTTLVLNKCDKVTPEQIAELKAIVRSLQKDAKIVEATQSNVPLGEIMNTGRFNFERAYDSAAWIDAMEHPEEHDDPEVLEYGIETFVYERRKPFDADKFNELAHAWPSSIIRTKGMLWAAINPDMCDLFEQAGKQMSLSPNGYFVASAPAEERSQILLENPKMLDDWDPVCGDRMTKLCVIGRNMNRASIEASLDSCLTDWEPQA